MKKLAIALVLGLVLAPGLAAAQEPQPAQRADRLERMSGGLARLLLEQQAELQLSAEQVARLEEIAASLEAENQAHVEALEARRAERRAQEEAARAHRAAMREEMLQLRANARESGAAAREVLTEEQREKLRALMKERIEQRMQRRRTRGQDGPPRH